MRPEIVITADRIASITAQFSASHGGRPPHEEELGAGVDAYARDEMLYREGLALGLDQDDPVVRSRIRQKADLLSEDALTSEPSDRDLEAYLAAHQAEFDIPGRVSFQQIYIDPGRRRRRRPRNGRHHRPARAEHGKTAGYAGDRTLLPATMTDALPRDVEAAFGHDFARQLTAIDGDGWQGPLTTSYGLHLVRITLWRERDPCDRSGRASRDCARVVTRASRETERAVLSDAGAPLHRSHRTGRERSPDGKEVERCCGDGRLQSRSC